MFKKYKKFVLDTASPSPSKSNILLIYTGGTFGMEKSTSESLIPFDFSKVIESIPVIKTFDLKITSVVFDRPIDSSNINPDYWTQLFNIIVKEKSQDGFVILHGTDTMAFTASALSYALHGLNKPVIITGAQLPVTMPRTDAHENLIASLEIASSKDENGLPIIPEVCVFFNHLLMRGNRSQKVKISKFDAFQSENYPPLAEAGIEIKYNHSHVLPLGRENIFLKKIKWFKGVAVLKIFPGITKEVVNSILENSSVRGVVLETFGAGNAMTDFWFIEAISRAVEKQIVIINVSQCLGGQVKQGMYATSILLEEAGVINGSDITIEAAITKLMFVLGNNNSYKKTIKYMLSPICGEIS